MASEVTLLLEEYKNGDPAALDQLTRLIYPELKAMARRRAGGQPGLGATTLVNETFVKLLSGGDLQPEDRQQFFGLAATIMRQVIVDEVRYAAADKRRGMNVTYTDASAADEVQAKADFLLQVDRTVARLEAEDPRLARVFECRYFGGFSVAETAECLGVSLRSAERLWSSARARIADLMSDSSTTTAPRLRD
jgi:RNA polymerase sigma factor (TIGR02999 family)